MHLGVGRGSIAACNCSVNDISGSLLVSSAIGLIGEIRESKASDEGTLGSDVAAR